MNNLYFSYFSHHASLSATNIVGIWIAAFLTIAIFSFLYKDNPVYKFAEYLFVGVSAGYQFTILYRQYLMVKMIDPLTSYMKECYDLVYLPDTALSKTLLAIKDNSNESMIIIKYSVIAFLYYVLPSLIGLMILTRLIKDVEWMSKYPIAYYIGYGTGVTLMIKIHSDIITQIGASIKSIPQLYEIGGIVQVGSYLIFVIGLCCSLVYFYFSSSQKGIGMKAATKIGIWVLMITFGAQFGFTIMARISLLIGRMQFLLGNWLGLIS